VIGIKLVHEDEESKVQDSLVRIDSNVADMPLLSDQMEQSSNMVDTSNVKMGNQSPPPSNPNVTFDFNTKRQRGITAAPNHGFKKDGPSV
jgi:hypothetical protein